LSRLKKILGWLNTSHSAYVATSTELDGVKIDGFLYPNLM
jgi:hypothetical protein